jgi:preprotein translocase subunit SecF
MEFFKKRTNIDFMGKRKRWYAISAALVAASIVLLLVRGLNLGIDFTGGVVMEVSFPQAADLGAVRWRRRATATRSCRASARRATC